MDKIMDNINTMLHYCSSLGTKPKPGITMPGLDTGELLGYGWYGYGLAVVLALAFSWYQIDKDRNKYTIINVNFTLDKYYGPDM